jgi:hypothetical protein
MVFATASDRLYVVQEITKLLVVDLHTVIQVEADTMIGVVAELPGCLDRLKLGTIFDNTLYLPQGTFF